MKLFRADRLFEEAGRSAESCEKLLLRLQRGRKINFLSMLVLPLIALALCTWALVPLTRWLSKPTFPPPPSVELVTSIPHSLIYSGAASIFSILLIQFSVLLYNEACIKMLLLLRGYHSRPHTPDNIPRDA